jgi:hypothetical protein
LPFIICTFTILVGALAYARLPRTVGELEL